MAAPKKPDYARLRKIVQTEVSWGVQGRQERFLELIDRAEWLEGQRAEKPVALSVSSTGDGKGFRGPDFKKGR